jgi:hypothetical protein
VRLFCGLGRLCLIRIGRVWQNLARSRCWVAAEEFEGYRSNGRLRTGRSSRIRTRRLYVHVVSVG